MCPLKESRCRLRRIYSLPPNENAHQLLALMPGRAQTYVPQRALDALSPSGGWRPIRPVGCIRGLGRAFPGPRNLAREPAAVLVDASWELASKLIELIDDTCEPLLAFEISVSEYVRNTSVILLAHSQEVPEVAPAP